MAKEIKNITPFTEKKFVKEGIYDIIECHKEDMLFDILWNSGMFTSKSALNRLFEQGAIKYHV